MLTAIFVWTELSLASSSILWPLSSILSRIESFFPIAREIEQIASTTARGQELAKYFIILLELIVLLKMRPETEINERLNAKKLRIEAKKAERLRIYNEVPNEQNITPNNNNNESITFPRFQSSNNPNNNAGPRGRNGFRQQQGRHNSRPYRPHNGRPTRGRGRGRPRNYN